MTIPQRALSAILCVVVAVILGVIARLPALLEQVDHMDQHASVGLTLSSSDVSGALSLSRN